MVMPDPPESDLAQRALEWQRRAELAQRQYQLLLDGLSDAVYLQDGDVSIVMTNRAGERLSG